MTKQNAHGLSAEAVFSSAPIPLSSVQALSFDGPEVTVVGAHLPPQGDPGLLRAEFEPGVQASFEYPLVSPDWGEHYWYWPNAEQSGFRVTIDLAACEPGSNPFRFRLVTDTGRVSTVFLTHDMSAAIGFPTHGNQLSRVQTFDTARTVFLSGYNHYGLVVDILSDHGIGLGDEVSILDWGCGHGRLARHFLHNWPSARLTGLDIDAENVGWCAERFPAGTFLLGPLHPPTALDSETFDVVFAISVMTHLTADVQREWLSELARVLKPGGLALLTFHGAAAAAFSSIDRDGDWWERWIRDEFDDGAIDKAIQTADESYYRSTFQTENSVRRTWTDHFDVIDVRPAVFGYQDVAILRRRSSS